MLSPGDLTSQADICYGNKRTWRRKELGSMATHCGEVGGSNDRCSFKVKRGINGLKGGFLCSKW